MKLSNSWLPVVLLACSASGCIQLKDYCDQCLVDCRNRCLAEKAWMSCKSCYADVDCRCDFGKGFKDGYVNVANGGGTCQPALPPECYWHFCYQDPCGQERMLAWFNGYTYGAIYAEQEGVSDWSRIVTAPTLPAYRKRRPGKTPAGAEDTATPDEYMTPGTPTPDQYESPNLQDAPAPPVPIPAPSAANGVAPRTSVQASQQRSSRPEVAGWTESYDAY